MLFNPYCTFNTIKFRRNITCIFFFISCYYHRTVKYKNVSLEAKAIKKNLFSSLNFNCFYKSCIQDEFHIRKRLRKAKSSKKKTHKAVCLLGLWFFFLQFPIIISMILQLQVVIGPVQLYLLTVSHSETVKYPDSMATVQFNLYVNFVIQFFLHHMQ